MQKVALCVRAFNLRGINPNIRMVAESLGMQRGTVSARFADLREISEAGGLLFGGIEFSFDMMPMEKCPHSLKLTERWALVKKAAKVQPVQLQLF